MASNYGLNFGFRRSDESTRVSEGRYRTPATGAALLIGTAVEVDTSAPGYLKASASNAKPITGFAGLLVQEELHLPSIYDPQVIDSYAYGVAKKNTLSVITGGAGTKVWLRNTAGSTRADGRVISAVTMFATASVAVGAKLGWNGTAWAFVDGTTITNAYMVVTKYDSTKGLIEAVLTA